MTLEQYAYLAEIVGVILVVASLVYLARQVNQNSELLKSGSRQALIANDHSTANVAIENSDLFELATKPEKLSFRDQWRFSMFLIMDMRNREHEYFQYRAGVLDENAWKSYRQAIRFSGSNARVQRWWKTIGRNAFDPDFVRMVDELHAELPEDDLLRRFGGWE
jgi:hypothetical protein